MNMENEIWKDVIGYEGVYMVSNKGGIRREKGVVIDKRGFERKIQQRTVVPALCHGRYLYTKLCVNNISKTFTVHQLMAISFLGHNTLDRNIVVDHVDNNQLNNNLENLQLITCRENNNKDRERGISKHIGVTWCASINKWRSRISIKGKRIHLGVFKNEIDASDAYQNKLNSL
jgi:hypothetical protein